jgi:hypothetical protein
MMFVALLSGMLLASETVANTAAPPAPVANEAAEAPDPNKKICKRMQVTGQLQGTKRVCMTAEQWKRTQEATQRAQR